MSSIRPSAAHKALWRVFTEYIRRRDRGRCFTCGVVGHWKAMQAGHFIHGSVSGKFNPLYFDEQNVHCQCAICNTYSGGMPGEYRQRLKARYGLRAVLALEKQTYNKEILTVEQMKRLKAFFKEELKKIFYE